MRRLFIICILALVPQFLCAQETAKYAPPAQVKASFKKMLDRPIVPLDVKITLSKAIGDGMVLEQLSFASEKKADGTIERVPTVILRPEKMTGKLPAVIVLHGTGGNKDGQIGFMKELVKQKYPRLVYPEHPRAIDYDRDRPGFRSQYPGGGGYAAFAYNVGYARAMMQAALSS